MTTRIFLKHHFQTFTFCIFIILFTLFEIRCLCFSSSCITFQFDETLKTVVTYVFLVSYKLSEQRYFSINFNNIRIEKFEIKNKYV